MQFWLGASFVETDQFIELAKVSERCGIHTLTLSDHIFYADFDSPTPIRGRARPAGTPRLTGPTCG
ncbi:hypothetical protein ACFQX6_29065 [Streptosporangium lutulentum]